MILTASDVSHERPVIAWWSGGVTSAITCLLCIRWFGVENVRVVMIDTRNEDEDTYRFMLDCERLYGRKIEVISNADYTCIEDVWYKYLSLNVANGAICSTDLKRQVRYKFQAANEYAYQAFGFEIDEADRARAMKLNYPDCRPIFPLIYELLTKKNCIKMLTEEGIRVPRTYEMGFHNNNCFKTGCVQGGIGYWQKMQREQPEKFDKMAALEHDLTNKKGKPVTMLKDQSKRGGLVFLKPHPEYPKVKDISMMKGREPKPLVECNGFCNTSINLFREPNKTAKEINFDLSIAV